MKTKKLIQEIFSEPTAPFCEDGVMDIVESILKRRKIPYFFDKGGNLIAGMTRPQVKAGKAKLALFAHTDHPGFIITKTKTGKIHEAKWFGGADFSKMKNAKLKIHDPFEPGKSVSGRVMSIKAKPYRRDGLPLKIQLAKPATLKKGCFGAFDFPAYQFNGNKLSTRAADDLAGVVIALGALLDKKGPMVAVFTRAEEVGFIGCLAFLEEKVMPPSYSISLEASKELPGAKIGNGPVLRLGDRISLYNTEISNIFWEVAKKAEKSKKAKFQRRIMDGGACEATALQLYGWPVMGLAVPLGNYHNQGIKGPAAEIVNLKDIEDARYLCGELSRALSKTLPYSNKKLKTSLLKNFSQLRKML